MNPPRELLPMMPALLEALNGTRAAVVMFGERDGTFAYWFANRAAAAQLGYTVEEVVQIPLLDTIAEEQRGLIMQLGTSFRAGQSLPATIEVIALHKDGHPVHLECSLGRLELGEHAGYAAVLREIDAPGMRDASSELSLLEADRISLVGALAAGFAHEINNPLTSVLLNLRSLRKLLAALPEATQRPAVRCLDDITTGAERIASNVRALQTLATRSGTQTIDLAAIVTSALRLVAPTVEPRAQVVRQIASVRAVSGEESRLGQAVLAMMLFSSSGFDGELLVTSNRIVVIVEERGPCVVVEVSDNGRDLTSDEVRAAFDPFFCSSARGAGVGVGLGVARSVATTLGGEVTLAPRLGGGAVITMRLPTAAR